MGKQIRLSYEDSDLWRCPKATINPDFPLQVKFNTGAHHWVERWFGPKVGYAFMCRYCYDVRKFPTSPYSSKVRKVIKNGFEWLNA